MKSGKLFAILYRVTVILIIASVMAACNDEPETAARPLKGSVTIPGEIMLGMEMEADIRDLSGGKGAYAYVWEKSDTKNGPFTAVETTSSAIYIPLKEHFAVGDFLRVIVSRGDDSTAPSNAAEIFEAVMIDEVNITDVFSDGVAIDPSEDRLSRGETYTIRATVIDENGKSDHYQQVIWSVSNNSSGTSITPSGTNTDGILTIGTNESGTITVRAVSVFEPNQFGAITLMIEGAPDNTYNLDIKTFEARSTSPAQNGGRDKADGTATAPDGGDAFYIQNAKSTIEISTGGTYEVYIILNAAIDAGGYNYLSYQVCADNAELTNDIAGHYPRLRSEVTTGTPHIQWQANQEWAAAKTALQADSTKWATVIIDFNASMHEGSAATKAAVMEKLDQVILRYTNTAVTPREGKIYFRNFKLHITEP